MYVCKSQKCMLTVGLTVVTIGNQEARNGCSNLS